MQLLSLLQTAINKEIKNLELTEDKKQIKQFCEEQQQKNVIFKKITVNMDVDIMALLPCLRAQIIVFEKKDLPGTPLPSKALKPVPQFSEYLTVLKICDDNDDEEFDSTRILDFTQLKNLVELECNHDCKWSAKIKTLDVTVFESYTSIATSLKDAGGQLEMLRLTVFTISQEMWDALKSVASHITTLFFFGQEEDVNIYNKLSEIRFDSLQNLTVDHAPLPQKDDFLNVVLFVSGSQTNIVRTKDQKNVSFQEIHWERATIKDMSTLDWITSKKLVVVSVNNKSKALISRRIRQFCLGIETVVFHCPLGSSVARFTGVDVSVINWNFTYPHGEYSNAIQLICNHQEIDSGKVSVVKLILNPHVIKVVNWALLLDKLSLTGLVLEVNTEEEVDEIKMRYGKLISTNVEIWFGGKKEDQSNVVEYAQEQFPDSKVTLSVKH